MSGYSFSFYNVGDTSALCKVHLDRATQSIHPNGHAVCPFLTDAGHHTSLSRTSAATLTTKKKTCFHTHLKPRHVFITFPHRKRQHTSWLKQHPAPTIKHAYTPKPHPRHQVFRPLLRNGSIYKPGAELSYLHKPHAFAIHLRAHTAPTHPSIKSLRTDAWT